MTTSRTRLAVMATVLGLIAVLGVVWLVKSATTGGQKTTGSGTDTSAARSTATSDATDGGTTGSGDTTGNTTGNTKGSGQPTGNATGGGQTTGNTTGSGQTTGSATGGGGRTPGGGKTPGGDKRSISVNGLRIDGNGHNDGCVTFINKTATPARITGVSFTKTSGAGHPTISSDKAAHCDGQQDGDADPPCDGLRLIEGNQCQAGAVLGPGAHGHYKVDAVASYTFVCDNAEIDPCDRASEAGGPPPSPQNPVSISGKSEPLGTELDAGGTPPDTPPTDDTDNGNPPQPVNPPPGGTPTTPSPPKQ
ncbi:hypothetical protein AB0945_17370 [Streptomyces sp. NPDC005474]|uniref:hypothetical protein n=1 Tax=Streptomyces sp. NPDC005474 TaxID=3154878 RepID=UPI003452E135